MLLSMRMPGHTNAALASYPELNCNGVAPALYTGIEVGFSTFCLEKDLTYTFIDDVVREIAAMNAGFDLRRCATHPSPRNPKIKFAHMEGLRGTATVTLLNVKSSTATPGISPTTEKLNRVNSRNCHTQRLATYVGCSGRCNQLVIHVVRIQCNKLG